jgi:hypothetical protein
MRFYVFVFCVLFTFLLVNAFPIIRKKGVPITSRDCPTAIAVGAIWGYDFETDTAGCAGVENVPMITGEYDVGWPLGGNSKWIMGFNEPDLDIGNLISPAHAAELWHGIELKYPSRKLLAPAPSNNPDGYSTNPKWLTDFRDAYILAYKVPPRLDGLAVHCYRQYASECITLTTQYVYIATTWNIPEVWVTEFSFCMNSDWCSNAGVDPSVQEMQKFMSWMEDEVKVTRFAWFATKYQGTERWADPRYYTPLVDWNTGQLTRWGNTYLPYR